MSLGICDACKDGQHPECIDFGRLDNFERWMAGELAAREEVWRNEGWTGDLSEDLEAVMADLERQKPYRSCVCHHEVS